jgi:hypothetical protein
MSVYLAFLIMTNGQTDWETGELWEFAGEIRAFKHLISIKSFFDGNNDSR